MLGAVVAFLLIVIIFGVILYSKYKNNIKDTNIEEISNISDSIPVLPNNSLLLNNRITTELKLEPRELEPLEIYNNSIVKDKNYTGFEQNDTLNRYDINGGMTIDNLQEYTNYIVQPIKTQEITLETQSESMTDMNIAIDNKYETINY